MQQTDFLDKHSSMMDSLKTIPVLECFEEQELSRLLEMSKIRKYRAGECIVEEGRSDTGGPADAWRRRAAHGAAPETRRL